jgi:DNA anti-recombination protein RmuC
MEKQMVQCEDGRRRQARIHGIAKQEGDFKIWQAAVRLKGKHVSGEAWYSYKTKTWYFLADPEGKHVHLMERLNTQLREESIRQLEEQLKVLESRQLVEQKKIDQHHAAKKSIETEMEAVANKIKQMKSGAPLEPDQPLEYSGHVRRR